jgi:hypothetical protein
MASATGAATAVTAWAGVGFMPPAAQGFALGWEFALRSSHRTLPFVSPAISVLGFVVVGRLGNISSFTRVPIVGGGLELGLLFAGDTLEPVETPPTHGVFFCPFASPEAPPSAGKGLLGAPATNALPQLPCLETAERDDCAVEDLRRSTRRPEVPAPLPVVFDDRPGKIPAGPGNDG